MSTTADPSQPVPPPPVGQGIVPPAPPPPAASQPYGYVPHQPTHPPIASNGTRFLAYVLDSVLIVVTLWIGWTIWAAITAGNGQTPGKKLLGIQIWDLATDRPMSWAKLVFLRGVLFHGFVAGFVYVFTLGITLLMPLWDKQNQTVVDKMSSSLCVKAS